MCPCDKASALSSRTACTTGPPPSCTWVRPSCRCTPRSSLRPRTWPTTSSTPQPRWALGQWPPRHRGIAWGLTLSHGEQTTWASGWGRLEDGGCVCVCVSVPVWTGVPSSQSTRPKFRCQLCLLFSRLSLAPSSTLCTHSEWFFPKHELEHVSLSYWRYLMAPSSCGWSPNSPAWLTCGSCNDRSPQGADGGWWPQGKVVQPNRETSRTPRPQATWDQRLKEALPPFSRLCTAASFSVGGVAPSRGRELTARRVLLWSSLTFLLNPPLKTPQEGLSCSGWVWAHTWPVTVTRKVKSCVRLGAPEGPGGRRKMSSTRYCPQYENGVQASTVTPLGVTR